jgi:nitrite reductase/ring-hydroxylating ferredoxin subunit
MSTLETLRWMRIALVSEIEGQEAVPVEVEGRSIALFTLDGGELRATDNVCTHAYALLTDGWIEDGIVECPLHAGRFDVRTGCGLGAPISEDLKTYPIRVSGEEVQIGLEPDPG